MGKLQRQKGTTFFPAAAADSASSLGLVGAQARSTHTAFFLV